MAEDNNYDPGQWKGHDFGTARSYYTASAPAAASQAAAQHVQVASLVPDGLVTQSTSPLVVMVDVTGSMGTWPGVIFSKLPYLDIEGKAYLGPDMEISFAANGDLLDQWPLQIQPFGSGLELKDRVLKLLVEGGGRGPDSGCEAYELGALYYARCVEMPNAVKPVFIFVADEQPHARVTAQVAKTVKIDIASTLTVDEVFAELKTRYSVYLVHKAYSPTSRREWVRLLGEDHIVDLQEPERVVDVIFGLLAMETGRTPYFRSELEGRQTPAQVATVYKALETVHRNIGTTAAGHSTMHRPSTGTPTKSLL